MHGGSVERMTKAELRAVVLRPVARRRPSNAGRRPTRSSGTCQRWCGAGETVCAYVPVGFRTRVRPRCSTRWSALGVPGAAARRAPGRDGHSPAAAMGRVPAGGLVDARSGCASPPHRGCAADAIAAASVVLVPALAVDLARRSAGPRRGLLRPVAAAGRSGGAAGRRGPRRRVRRAAARRGARRADDACADAAGRSGRRSR